jgi:ABC-type transport system involved in multi-copper enzyme maturation permease subunit
MSVVIDYILRFFSLYWLTGPVFDKELRVSSRQRRNYVLRFVYISLLLTILFFLWIAFIDYRGTNVVRVSRMAEAGKAMVTYIVWFQFCAAQIIAVVMLSNSISDEIYHKTLGMLMTTPISSLQIVMGKLLSKLLQLLLLLAISMPLLAIVRMFGGVPWDFITSSLCLTFTTVLFVSSLSLFYSIFCRRAYVVIIVTVLTLLVLFALIPFLLISVITLTELYKVIDERILLFVFYQPNPYINFFFNTMMMLEPRASTGFFNQSVFINSGIFLVLSLLLLLLSVVLVRKVALRQATGQLFSSSRKKTFKNETLITAKNSAISRVIGPPVLWKEIILPLRRNIKIYRIIGAIIFLTLLFYSYWFFTKEKAIDDDGVQGIYAIIFTVLGTLFTIVISAVSITSEKESNAWPLLLTSTLKDSQIVIGKLYGVLSRCLPVWLLLLGHIFYFYIKGVIHPIAVPLTIGLVAWFVFFICSTGMYFSSVFKHSTTAIIMNFLLIVSLWGIIPFIFSIISEISHDRDIGKVSFFVNPLVQVCVIIFSTLRNHMNYSNGIMQFSWPNGWESSKVSYFAFCISFCIYTIIALIFLWRAKKRLRYKIF